MAHGPADAAGSAQPLSGDLPWQRVHRASERGCRMRSRREFAEFKSPSFTIGQQAQPKPSELGLRGAT